MELKIIVNYFTAFIGVSENLLYSGCVFGWTALVFIFEKDGIYSHLCESGYSENTTNISIVADHKTVEKLHVCDAQQSVFNLCYTIGTAIGYAMFFPNGLLNDNFNNRIMRGYCCTGVVCGFLCLGFASQEVPWLIFPGLIFLCICGFGLFMNNCQIGNLFKKPVSLAVMATLSAGADASVLTFTLAKICYQFGIERRWFFVGLSVCFAISIGFSTLVLLPKNTIMPADERKKKVKNDSEEQIIVQKPENDNLITEDNRSFKECLLTITSFIIFIWTAILDQCVGYILGFWPFWLNYVTEKNTKLVSYFTNVYSVCVFLSVFTGPIQAELVNLEEKRLMKRDGFGTLYHDKIRPFAIPQALTTITAIVAFVLCYTTQLWALYVQIIAYSIFRAFLYGLSFGFVAVAFPYAHFGKITGLYVLGSAFICLANYGIFMWMIGPPVAVNYVTILFLFLLCVTFVQPIYAYFGDSIIKCGKSKTYDQFSDYGSRQE